jgi:hypothetical protein
MTEGQVQALLGRGHKQLADDLVLYDGGHALEDPLIKACQVDPVKGRLLIWVALVMADHRLATVVETVMTDERGKLRSDAVNADHLEIELRNVLPGTTRKTATNILSYYRDSGIVVPVVLGGTIVGILQAPSTAPAVGEVVAYTAFRLRWLGMAGPGVPDVDLALRARANSWDNLTPAEFRDAVDSQAAVAGPAPAPQGVLLARPRAPRQPAASAIASSIQEVNVERQHIERFAISRQAERVGRRHEQSLVLAYKSFMEQKGSQVVGLRYLRTGEVDHIYCDLFDKARNNLLEAKAAETRPAIRMAIGQLCDYKRSMVPLPHCAVLTPRRPRPDLEALLASVDIACVWRDGTGFRDNADDTFV